MEDAPSGSATAVLTGWPVALLGSALVLACGHVYTLYYAGWGSGVLRPIGLVLLIVGVLFGVAGLAVTMPLLRSLVREYGKAVVVPIVLGVLGLPFVAALLIFPFSNTVVVIAGGLILLQSIKPEPPLSRSARARLSLPYSLAILVLVPVGALHTTVWDPSAKLPGWSLAEIYAGLAAGGELSGVTPVIMWAVAWTAVALAVPAVCLLDRTAELLSPRRIACAGLILIAATGYSLWLAGFGIGMSMADTFEQVGTGGDVTPTGVIIAIVAQLALVGALIMSGRR